MSYTLPWGSLNPDPDGDLAAIGSPTDALCLLDQNTAFGGGTMQSVLMVSAEPPSPHSSELSRIPKAQHP